MPCTIFIPVSRTKIIIDAAAKKIVDRYPVSRTNLDFGAINTLYSGKKNRYVYAAVVESMPKMVGLVKLDLSLSVEDCTVASRMYGAGCYGRELVFVAREAAEEEDDGYLVAYVSNEKTQESHFVVMDAKSPTLGTVATVKLPRRVPQGFHSIFIKQSDLLKITMISWDGNEVKDNTMVQASKIYRELCMDSDFDVDNMLLS